jgi:hypothetical protein
MMKKITFLFTMLFMVVGSWQTQAQFTEDFEGTFLPSGWAKETPDTSNDITQSSSQNHTAGGSLSARFSSFSSSSDYNQYLFTAAIMVQAGVNDQISFWHRKHNTSNELLEWGITTAGQTSTDVNTWNSVTLSSSDWQKTTVDLSPYDGQIIYFAWHYYGDYLYYVYLDDVVNEPIPSCSEPTGLAVDYMSAPDTAGFTWDAVAGASGYNYEIQPQGTAQGTAGAVSSGNGSNNNFNATNLVAGTDYTLYVQTDCGGGDTSMYSSLDFSFNPPPANDDMGGATPITPSAEGTGCSTYTFQAWTAGSGVTDSGMDGSCNGTDTGLDVFYSWTATSPALIWNDGDGNPGIIIRDTSGTEITCEGTYANDDTILSGWNVGDDLIIQIYDYATADVDVSFCLEEISCLAPSGLTTTNITATSAEYDWVENGTATAWNFEMKAGADFTPGNSEYDISGNTTIHPFSPATTLQPGTTYYWYVQADCGGGDSSAWVGSSFTTLESCPVPSGLTTTDITATSAKIDWTENGSATQWNVEYKAGSDFTPGNGEQDQMGSFYTHPYALAGFQPETTYYWYVQADCGGGDTSSWVGSSFTTLPLNDACADATPVYALPYTNSQNASGATNNDGFINDCGLAGMNDGVWYTFTVDTAGDITVEITPTGWDPQLDIYTGACGAFTCVDQVDDGGTSSAESITFTAAAGTQYWVNIGYYSGSTDGSEGPFDISITTTGAVLGIANNLIDGFNMYPNPVTNTLNLKAQDSIDAVSIYNMLGQEVLKSTPSSTQAQMDMTMLPTGAYIVKVQVGDQIGSYNLLKQ